MIRESGLLFLGHPVF